MNNNLMSNYMNQQEYKTVNLFLNDSSLILISHLFNGQR